MDLGWCKEKRTGNFAGYCQAWAQCYALGMTRWKLVPLMSPGAARRALAAALFALLASCAAPAPSQKSFLLPIDLRCTTCNDFLRCAATGADPANDATELTVYRLGEKSFWGQVATIGEYAGQLTHAKTGDTRPLTVYRREQGHWRVLAAGTATIDITAARIALQVGSAAAGEISQRDGLLQSPQGSGQCQAMPRREGFGLIRQLLGRPLPPHTPSAAPNP